MSTFPVSESLANATEVTEVPPHSNDSDTPEVSGYVEGPIWIEKSKRYDISKMSMDHLLSARNQCLMWLGNHARILERKRGEAEHAMTHYHRTGDTDARDYAIKSSDEGLSRKQKMDKIREVMENLENQIDLLDEVPAHLVFQDALAVYQSVS